MPVRRLAAPTVLLGLLGVLASAEAGNTVHPRTPVLWPDAPCIASVDRSLDPTFEFAYTIPAEDTNVGVDELDDSRTQQFIGFCRQWPPGSVLPGYISVADLQRAITNGVETDASKLEDPEATLETSLEWADCWTRITPDDLRRPITFAAAAEPVVWMTSEVPAGTWVVGGYTWEPPYNLWRRSPWVVRVFDGESDPALLQPAVTIGPTPEVVWEDEPVSLDLCAAADSEATVRIAWATTEDEVPVWHEGEATALAGASLISLPFVTPPEAWGLTVLLRARVEGSSGSDYASYSLASVIVIKPGGVEGGESDSTGESESDSAGESDSDSAGESESTSDPGLTDEGSSDACQCTSNSAGSPLVSALGLLGLCGLLGRRRPQR